MQHSAYKGDVWPGPDDFVRNCFGIEGNGQDGFKAWATATSQEWHQSGFLLGLDSHVHLDFIGGAIRSKNLRDCIVNWNG